MKKSILAISVLAVALPIAASGAILGEQVTLVTDQAGKKLTFAFEDAAPSGYYHCSIGIKGYTGEIGAFKIASTANTVVNHYVPTTPQSLPFDEPAGTILVMASNTHPAGSKKVIEFDIFTPTSGISGPVTVGAKCYGNERGGKQYPFDCGNGAVPDDFCLGNGKGKGEL